MPALKMLVLYRKRLETSMGIRLTDYYPDAGIGRAARALHRMFAVTCSRNAVSRGSAGTDSSTPVAAEHAPLLSAALPTE